MSNIQLTVAEISKLRPIEIIENQVVHDRFVKIYESIHGEGMGEGAYQRESNYFKQAMLASDKLRNAESFSIFLAFIDLAVCGLSLAPGTQTQCYVEARGYKTGQKDERGSDIYANKAALVVSGYGELIIRQKAGQILHADNPVLVYEEDLFSFSDKNGRKTVDYTCRIPHTSGHIVACYMHITRIDGSDDYAIMLEEDWLRLKEFSAKSNRGKWNPTTRQYDAGDANALYSSANGGIDPGFLKAKCIKHAFKTYPKVKLGIGKATVMETDIDEQTTDYYGIAEESSPMQSPMQAVPVSSDTVAAPHFATSLDATAGVVIETNNDDTF